MDLKNINKLNNYILLFYISISILIISLLLLIFNAYDSYDFLLDKLYNYDLLLKYISNNFNFFMSFVIGYFLLLGLISSKKGLISTTSSSSHYNAIINIYKGFGFLSLIFIYYLYEKGNFFELFILILNSCFSIFIGFFILSYAKNIQNINTLKFLNNNLNNENPTYKIIFSFFNSFLDYYIGVLFIISFLIFPLGMYLKFNLITSIYIHLSFIISYTGLNIFKNKFATKVNIGFNGKIYRNYYLMENINDKIVISNDKKFLVFRYDKLDFIEIKRTNY